MNKTNKIIIFILFILIFGLCILTYINNLKEKQEHILNLFYMDTHIYIKFKEKDLNKAKKIEKEIEKIYDNYHKLTDRYNSYEGINNIYYINYNNSNDEFLTLDKELYNIIKIGKEMHQKSNYKLDISMGNVIDIWRSYRESKIGIPTYDELKKVDTNSIDDIILLDDYKIKNNHPNIDLGSIAKGYATEKVGEYLKRMNVTEFLINAGGNVLVGKKDNNEPYKVGLENPNSTSGEVFKVLKISSKSVVTSGGYERNYIYNGQTYHHIIDPDTLFPSNYMKSVTVITDSSTYGDFLSTTLFLMNIEDGKKYVDSLDNVEAIWYSNDNEIITSKGLNKYE